jgi:hypothetical protein
MSFFQDSENDLDSLKNLDEETYEAPNERLGSPEAARTLYETLSEEDADSSFNRSLIQQQMDFGPPHDDKELENKGQSDRFNITTGEGPAIKNEAVAAYMDIYTTPKVLADIPLTKDIDPTQADTWSSILAEEFTTMDRNDDASLPLHLQLCDTYVTHGVAIGYFDDKFTMRYSVAGLDHFKFPRSTGIISSEVELATALGEYTVASLYSKIEEGSEGWNPEMVKRAIVQCVKTSNNKKWDNWEIIQREIKANEIHVTSVCQPIQVIHTWVREFDGKISYYISARNAVTDKNGTKEEFLFKSRGFFDSADQGFQIFPFSVGNGGKLYTVRGLGYLIYQLCNAMDIMHCKLLDNARVSSSLIVQPGSVEDMQDMQLTDFGGGIAIPPNMKIPDRQMTQNLNNTLIPAINESRSILNRATGGISSGNMMMQPDQDRRTKLEVSSQLDYINKINSFAINLFYGPYDKIMREKVRRAYTVPQKNKAAKKRVNEMKARCIARGVPEEIFKKIDFKGVKASRIIGTGSRSSRIMLMDQMQQMYSTWDAVGRSNFEYDYLVELVGAEKAERYAGKPNEVRLPYDHKIAKLENLEMLEGDVVDPVDGENHMVHLPVHIEELEAGLKGVDEGLIDIMDYTMKHKTIYEHCVATLEVTTVHETVQPELNQYHQRVQQIGEIVMNGMKMINKQNRENAEAGAQAEQEGQAQMTEDQLEQQKLQQELQMNDIKHKQKLQQEFQNHTLRLQMIKEAGQQKMVMQAQDAMGKIASRDAEVQQRMNRLRASSI